MGVMIRCQAGDVEVHGELYDTATARAIVQVLPLEATVRTWGEEIYFSIPVHQELDETARQVVAPGEIGYWPAGPALCLFFGPTPISGPGEIRAASAVNIVGQLQGEIHRLRQVKDGIIVKVEVLADP